MPDNDDENEWDDYNPLGWDNQVQDMWDAVTYESRDIYAITLFDTAYVTHGVDPDVRAAARQMIQEWLSTEIGIDFDDNFDWESWREWYDSA